MHRVFRLPFPVGPKQSLLVLVLALFAVSSQPTCWGQLNRKDARNQSLKKPDPVEDPELQRYGIYQATAPRAGSADPIETRLPLDLKPGSRIAFIGNMLLERSQYFGHLETLLHQQYPDHKLVIRNLGWPADTADLQPRPDNFADVQQHLAHEKIDVIFAAFGFNESFAGPEGLGDFEKQLSAFLTDLQTKAFNGESAPLVVLLSPVANENVDGVPAADRNNENLRLYSDAVRRVAGESKAGHVDVFTSTRQAMQSPGHDLTINGVHLNEAGYELFAESVTQQITGQTPDEVANPFVRWCWTRIANTNAAIDHSTRSTTPVDEARHMGT